jgi:Na+/phosphate symporter
MAQVEQQLHQAIEIVKKKFAKVNELLLSQDDSLDEIVTVEEAITGLHKQRDQLHKELNKFLVALAQKDLSAELSQQVTKVLYLNKDLDIISSQLNKFLSILLEQAEDGLKINSSAQEELHLCLSKTAEVFAQLTIDLSPEEPEIEKLRQSIYSQSLVDQAARTNHLDRLKSGEHDPLQGIAFLNALRSISSMLASMQHICNHLQGRF